MSHGLVWPWTEQELVDWESQPCAICGSSPVTLWTGRDVYCESHSPDDRGVADD